MGQEAAIDVVFVMSEFQWGRKMFYNIGTTFQCYTTFYFIPDGGKNKM